MMTATIRFLRIAAVATLLLTGAAIVVTTPSHGQVPQASTPNIDGFVREFPATLWFVDGQCFVALALTPHDVNASFTVTVPSVYCKMRLS